MKRNIFMLMLLSVFILIAPANAVTLTQKLGNGYIKQNVNEGKNVTLSFSNSSYYTFQNWDVESSNVSVDTSSSNVSFSMPSEDVTIRANYDADIPEGGTGGVVGGGGGGGTSTSQYLITYDANGGSGSMADQTVLIGMSVTLNTNTFTNGSYVFKGWSTIKNGNVVYKDGESIVPTSNLSLYAVWREDNPGKLLTNWYILGSKTNITTIEFVDEYTPTGNETDSWNADTDSSGKIKCYVVGTKLIISGNGSGYMYANEDSSSLFNGFTNVTSIKGLDEGILDTSKVTNMSSMFSNCSSLYLLDLSTFDVSNVTNMSNMFNGCSALNRLTTSTFDTSKVTNMSYMFANCNVANIDLSILNTSAVTNMSYMFYKSSCPDTINVSSFNTSKVTNMSYMFASSNVKTLDLSNFNTLAVITRTSMFDTCNYLRKVTLGANCNVGTLLPTPSSTYITGATGYWYSPNGVTCKSSSIPNNTAETYYANVEDIAYKFKLSYNENGGASNSLPPVQVYAGNATSFTFKISSSAVREYYWSYNQSWGGASTTTWHKNGTQYTAGSNITISSNTTLYAYWNSDCDCYACNNTIADLYGVCSSCSSTRCDVCGYCINHGVSLNYYCGDCGEYYHCGHESCQCCGDCYSSCPCSGEWYTDEYGDEYFVCNTDH